MELNTTRRKFLALTAGIVVSTYFFLASVAFFCATTHANHHGHGSSHSPLCAWSCQVNSSVGPIALETPALPILLAIFLLPFHINSPFSPLRLRLGSRGPPVR